MRHTVFLVVLIAMLVGCTPQAPGPLPSTYESQGMPATPVASARVRVELLNVIRDTTAYNNQRGVYLITDTTTGQQFIGVSGVGISEVGSHSAGKTTTSDER